VPTIACRERLDHDSAGLISQDEMNSTGLLMTADLCDPGPRSMPGCLLLKAGPLAIEAASL